MVPSPSARRLHRGVRAQELPLPLRGGAGRRGGGAPGDDVGAARARAAWRAARRQGEDAAYDAHDEDRDEDPEARCAPAPDAAIAIVSLPTLRSSLALLQLASERRWLGPPPSKHTLCRDDTRYCFATGASWLWQHRPLLSFRLTPLSALNRLVCSAEDSVSIANKQLKAAKAEATQAQHTALRKKSKEQAAATTTKTERGTP
eukprot:COSAG06_NODE_918_length_11551_cov_4.681802_2_plen_203_part_00